MYRNRDMGINYIKARKDHRCYGMGLGIIILDDVYPGFPGDVRNASAYPFPIQYEIAEGVDIQALVNEEDKSPCLEPIQRAAKKLERMGCRAGQSRPNVAILPTFSKRLPATWTYRCLCPACSRSPWPSVLPARTRW